ncbi:MAG: polyprenyl synthetase family protein [Thermoplasmata archaeon]|nr:polyprenyl synthetase family protein [Thermoplasmata archaeon]
MEFSTLLDYRARLEETLHRQFSAERRRVDPVFRPYLDSISEFTLRGGKRFRALLLLAGYWVACGRDPAPVLPAAAALEQFQTWMLVHDDIIDHAETRRGGPTLHRSFEQRHRTAGLLGRSDEFGVGIGITLGDLAEPLTVAGLLEAPVARDRKLRALAEYDRMTRETAYGQLLDIQNGATPVERVREADVLRVHRLKSAFYTVASPLRLGAILGGARPALLEELKEFGLDVGVAFQLRDDVLGAGLDAGNPGKSANDLIEGKRTLLVIRAWEGTDDAGRARLRAVLNQPDASSAAIESAKTVIRETGSLAYSEKKINLLRTRACRRVERSRALRRAARPLLLEICDRLVYRTI